MPQDWFKCLWKKRRDRVRFRLQRQGGGSKKISFTSDWAENLAEITELRALTSPRQHLVQGDQKFPKIMVEERLEDL